MIREVAPPPELAAIVDAFWYSDGGPAVSMRVLPDGCADVLFDCDRASALIIGTMTRPLEVAADESGLFFGVRFRAGRAASIVRQSLAAFTDMRVAADQLRTVAERIADTGIVDARIAIASAWLRSRLTDSSADARAAAAVDLIVRSGGRIPIEEVATTVGATRQHLARLFAHHVGVSPKVFARVMRFRRALRLAKSARDRWADLALELGYFDQSHLIAEFRQFAGDTPVPFFLSS